MCRAGGVHAPRGRQDRVSATSAPAAMPHHARTGSGPLKPLENSLPMPAMLRDSPGGPWCLQHRAEARDTENPQDLSILCPPITGQGGTTRNLTHSHGWHGKGRGEVLCISCDLSGLAAEPPAHLCKSWSPAPAINQTGFHAARGMFRLLKGGIFLLPSSSPSPGLEGETRCWRAFRKGRLLRCHMRAICIAPVLSSLRQRWGHAAPS